MRGKISTIDELGLQNQASLQTWVFLNAQAIESF